MLTFYVVFHRITNQNPSKNDFQSLSVFSFTSKCTYPYRICRYSLTSWIFSSITEGKGTCRLSTEGKRWLGKRNWEHPLKRLFDFHLFQVHECKNVVRRSSYPAIVVCEEGRGGRELHWVLAWLACPPWYAHSWPTWMTWINQANSESEQQAGQSSDLEFVNACLKVSFEE